MEIHRRAESHFRTGRRMLQSQLGGVQTDAGGGSAAVESIAENGKAFVRRMHTDLMGAARERLNLKHPATWVGRSLSGL